MTLRVLTSFHYFRGVDMAGLVTELGEAYGGDVHVFADSGAFSAVTTGATIALPDYTAWLHQWQHLFTTMAGLDVIGDHEATARNTSALHTAGLPALPTFHIGSPWPVLEDLCSRHPYIALGGMVPYFQRPREVMRWLIHAFRIAAHTGSVFHGFGQTNHNAVTALPFYSVDSSTWSSGMRFGHMKLWDDRHHRLIELDPGDVKAARSHARLLRSHGADPLTFATPGFAYRAAKTEEAYHAERAILRGAPALAFHRFGDWLQKRHLVTAPTGWVDPGTVLYLAGTNITDFVPAARLMRAVHRKEALT